MRITLKIVRRISNEVLEIKGLINIFLCSHHLSVLECIDDVQDKFFHGPLIASSSKHFISYDHVGIINQT